MRRLTYSLTLLALASALCCVPLAGADRTAPRLYVPMDFSYLIGMPGFGDQALKMHFKLYQGYVTNTNTLLALLAKYAEEGRDRSPEYAEIKRRLGWEFDGMRLHELYFENLGGQGTLLPPDSPLSQQIVADFGSMEAWQQDFQSTGAMRGIGWVVLYFDPVYRRLMNVWVGEHDVGNLATARPLLIMDVWEHAYLPDYGLDRMEYIHAFFNNIQWDVVQKRFPAAYRQ